MSPSAVRQQWIEAALATLRERFAGVGYTAPDKLRISIGWPRGSHGKGAPWCPSDHEPMECDA